MSTEHTALRTLIESAFEHRTEINPKSISRELKVALDEALDLLDSGRARVAEKRDGRWQVNDWLKKAVLLYFRAYDNRLIEGGHTRFFDKVPLKYAAMDEASIRESGARIVPDAVVRKGAYIGPNVVLMPSFVNIGAFVDSGTMVDTWATVGSCAQVGARCHISGGAGIGGVLEPLQAAPTIIEDDCFIGARSEVVEGVIVERGSVIGMGVFIGQSTRIYNRATGDIGYGRVPAGSVVVSGSLPSADGSHSLCCAVIVKQVDEKTRGKTSVNELLRGAVE